MYCYYYYYYHLLQWQKPEKALKFTCTFSTTELSRMSSMPYNIFLYIPQWWKQYKEMKTYWAWLSPTTLCSSIDFDPSYTQIRSWWVLKENTFSFTTACLGNITIKTSDESPLSFALFNHSKLYSVSVRREMQLNDTSLHRRWGFY